jgi:hypothetical protein
MRSLKNIVIVLGIVLVCAASSFAKEFKPGSEPDGFRGIKWGTTLSSLSGMQYLRTDPSFGGIKIYLRKGDELTIGGANLKRIEYDFWKDKFYGVIVRTEDQENFDALKAAVFEKFGEGSQSNEFLEDYAWSGGQTRMNLNYNKISKKGILFVGSTEIQKQIEAKDKQKAKEGAAKGF